METILKLTSLILFNPVWLGITTFDVGTIKLISTSKMIHAEDLFSNQIRDVLFGLELAKLIIVEDNLTDLPEKYNTQKTVIKNEDLQLIPINILQKSSQFECAFYFLRSWTDKAPLQILGAVNPNSRGLQLRSLLPFPFNLSPQNSHHVFVGPTNVLQDVFMLENIKVLKFKTGIGIPIYNSSGPEILIEQYPLQPRGSQPVRILKSNEMDTLPELDRFSCLRNVHFVAESYATRLNIITDDKNNPVGGVSYNIMKYMAPYYNFTFDYNLDGFQNVGQMPNGSWHGFIGDLTNGKVDFVFWLSPTYGRYPYFDPTVYITELDAAFLRPIPRVRVKWLAIMYPFTPEVWFCILFTCFAIFPIFAINFRRSEHHHGSSNALYHAAMLTFCSLILMSSTLPKRGHVLTVLFLFSSIVIGTFFNSNLISFLTFPEPESVPETLKELADMTEYHVDLINYAGSVSDLFFRHSSSPLAIKLRDRIHRIPQSELVDSVTKVAFDRDRVVINYYQLGMIAAAERLTLHSGFTAVLLAERFLPFSVSLALRRYSKYTDAMSYNVGKLQATGHTTIKWYNDILDFYRARGVRALKATRGNSSANQFYYQLSNLTASALASPVKPFTIVNFYFAFLGLGFGLVMGLICFTVEYGKHLVSLCRPRALLSSQPQVVIVQSQRRRSYWTTTATIANCNTRSKIFANSIRTHSLKPPWDADTFHVPHLAEE